MKTVMLVDDSATILMSMEAILSQAGLRVVTASNGEQALQLLQKGKPDLIITDLNMPGMDGISLIKHVRQMPGMRFVPILMLTTESQQSKRQEAKAAGATGWIVKPADPDKLIAVIKKVVPGA